MTRRKIAIAGNLTLMSGTASESFYLGLKAGSPIMAGVTPFGLIYGAAARDLGLSLTQTCGMSLAIFGGASQLVFLDLWSQGASTLVLIATGLVVNLRMLMYSASIAPRLGPLNPVQALIGAYFLTDESYGLSMSRYFSRRRQPTSPFYFFLGAGFPTWLSWQVSSLIGYLAGALLPESWPLGLAVPLVFLSLLVPMLAGGPKLVAALAAMITAVLAAEMPMNLGLLLAVFIGIAAGLAHEKMLAAAPSATEDRP